MCLAAHVGKQAHCRSNVPLCLLLLLDLHVLLAGGHHQPAALSLHTVPHCCAVSSHQPSFTSSFLINSPAVPFYSLCPLLCCFLQANLEIEMIVKKLEQSGPGVRTHVLNVVNVLCGDLPAAPVVYEYGNTCSSRQRPEVVATQPGQYDEDDAMLLMAE